MNRKTIVAAMVGFIALSYLVKVTNGCVFGAGRLVGETAAMIAWNFGASGVNFVTKSAKQTPEYVYQEELAKAEKAKGTSAPPVINVNVVLDGKQLTQAQAALNTQTPSGSQPTVTQVQ
jgi:hypothetical protein